MVLGFLDQLLIFSELYLIELLGLLTGLGLLELWHFTYPRLLTGFGMLVFFTNLSHGISGQIFGPISSFLSNRQLRVVLDRKSSQEYQVNAGVPAPFLILHFSYYIFMNFLMMLSVILLSMLMILLSILSVIGYI